MRATRPGSTDQGDAPETNPTHDLLKIEIAESPKYAGSDWCAEMFDRWDPDDFKNQTLGTGLDKDPRIVRSMYSARLA